MLLKYNLIQQSKNDQYQITAEGSKLGKLQIKPDHLLRDKAGLTGSKVGCEEGECGACTVLLGDTAVRSCITSIGEAHGATIQTIEGLAIDGKLHPIQQAFLEKQAMQCGYCVPGQILTAVALLRRKPNASRQEIIEEMNDNICRCCNYVNILNAVQHAAQP